jgi:acyl-coenzyme A synthetase/AMP-(fatty) acid ligase
MPPPDPGPLRTWSTFVDPASQRFLHGAEASVAIAELQRGSSLSVPIDQLFDRSVLVATKDQLPAALALIELDGVVRRMVLCPPDLSPQHLPSVIEAAEVDVIVADRAALDNGLSAGADVFVCSSSLAAAGREPRDRRETEWILLTSGTTGAPKLVVHTLSTLTGPFRVGVPSGLGRVWSTFYDIRRYGGLQIFLRAIVGGGSLVLSSATEPTAAFLARAGACGVTHISGTPSHWRRAFMSPAHYLIAPQYVRLSGEIADQAILDRLRASYPAAAIGHAFASTEAGVAFEVNDCLSGFPASLFDSRETGVEMKVEAGSLRLRSPRTALRYLNADNIGGRGGSLVAADGFVDTGDMIERRGDRCYFVGRKGGIINVGGCKVHPEEVEAVINRHPDILMSIVRGRKSPITGAIVVADVVAAGVEQGEALKAGILGLCRRTLAPYKVPATIRVVSALDITASGKLARRDA